VSVVIIKPLTQSTLPILFTPLHAGNYFYYYYYYVITINPILTPSSKVILIIFILLRVAYAQLTPNTARRRSPSKSHSRRHMSFVVKWGRER
jgi:hypothetical protein